MCNVTVCYLTKGTFTLDEALHGILRHFHHNTLQYGIVYTCL